MVSIASFESLILRIAENAGGDQRERNRLAAVRSKLGGTLLGYCRR